MPLRIIFMGTPHYAVPTLQAIHDAGHEIVAVYTQPPRPAGRRGLDLKASPVQQLAEKIGLNVRTPLSLKDAAEQSAFASLDADVAVVVAYGLLLPKPILGATRYGAYNAHASALPRWRGAAPIQRAIMAGDSQTAVDVMQMDTGLDTGPIALSTPVSIDPNETAGELHDRMAEVSAQSIVRALALLESGSITLTPQAGDGATYAAKIDKAETRIDWSRPAIDVHNHIRGLSPFPGAWCEMEIGGRTERVKILGSQAVDRTGKPGEILDGGLTIACGRGAVSATRLQRAGGKALDAGQFLRGSAVTRVS